VGERRFYSGMWFKLCPSRDEDDFALVDPEGRLLTATDAIATYALIDSSGEWPAEERVESARAEHRGAQPLTDTERAYFDSLKQVASGSRPEALRLWRMRLDDRDVAVVMQQVLDTGSAAEVGWQPLALILDEATIFAAARHRRQHRRGARPRGIGGRGLTIRAKRGRGYLPTCPRRGNGASRHPRLMSHRERINPKEGQMPATGTTEGRTAKPRARGAKAKSSSSKAKRQRTTVEAIKMVLGDATGPMTADEIHKEIKRRRLAPGLKGKTPVATISAKLSVGGEFTRVGRGTYELAD
jgi:hypothetical protein